MIGPSRTAEVVAYMRALEGMRAEPILVDPHAGRFLSPPLRAALALGPATARTDRLWRGWPGIGTYVATRHRWFDDRLVASEADEVIVLGAGYDSRAVRFPGPRYWEVDHPSTAARKRRIAPDHPAQRVDVDFSTQLLADRLVEAGFPVGARAFVVWEGVTMYLSRGAIRATLKTLHELLGPGSELVFDAFQVIDGPGLEAHFHRLSPALMPLVGEPVTFFLHPDDAPGFLASEGWKGLELEDASALRQRFAPDRVVYPSVYVVRAVREDRAQTQEAPAL
ncbi:MAG: SAM-dependent methyltransferase [Myxococcota bacterium]